MRVVVVCVHWKRASHKLLTYFLSVFCMFLSRSGCSWERTFKRIRRELKTQWKIFTRPWNLFLFLSKSNRIGSRSCTEHENILLSRADRFVCVFDYRLTTVRDTHVSLILKSAFHFHFFILPLCRLLSALLILSVFCDKPPTTCGQTACPHVMNTSCNGQTLK